MQFEVYRRAGEPIWDWCWRLRDTSCGAIVALGEGYATKLECLAAVELVRGTGSLTRVIEVMEEEAAQ